jgi:ribonuclease P protein component
MTKLYGLGRQERVKSRKSIEELFATGKSFTLLPLRVVYIFVPRDNHESSVQIGVAAAKKNFKKAVDRNRIKRLMREAYRLQKNPLKTAMAEKKESMLRIFFIYTGNEIPSLVLIKQKMEKAILRLVEEIKSLP